MLTLGAPLSHDDPAISCSRGTQRRETYVFCVIPQGQGNELFPRGYGLFSSEAQNPGFCAARAANERLFERSPRFGRKKTGGFLMARARIIFFRNAKQNRESLLWAPGGPPFFLFFLNRKTPSLNRSGGVTGLHMHIHADY